MKFFLSLIPILFIAISCASTGEGEASGSETAAVEKQCEYREVTTGTRLRRKICITPEQKAREKQESDDLLLRNQRQARPSKGV